MVKKILFIVLALLLITGVVATSCQPAPAPGKPAPAAEKKTYRWKYSVPLSSEHYTAKGARAFAKRVSDLSGGRIVIDVYDSAALGDWIPVFEEVMKGTVEFHATSYLSIHDPRLDLVWIPYLVSSWAQVNVAYSPGGWIFDTSARLNRELGVETIAALPDGFIGMGAKKMPPSPGDPNVKKNMKIRVWGAVPPEKLMTRLGYLVTILPWAEVFTALQTGVVDAVYGGSVISTYDSVRDVIKYWLPYNGNYEGLIVIMNLKLLNSLSKEYQDIIWKAAKEQQDARMAEAEASEKAYTQKMRDYGIQVYEFTPAEYKAMTDAAVKDVWPALQSMIGKKLMDEAVAYVATLK